MDHSVGKDVGLPGKFAYELWEGFDMVKRVGNFDTMKLAEQAAQQAQREHLFGHVNHSLHTSEDNVDKFAAMSDDELLTELLA